MDRLRQAGDVTTDVLRGHNRYHYALLHKLRCANNYVKKLEATLAETAIEEVVRDSKDLLFNVNANIDGFFYTGGSALDVLAREVLTYMGIPLPGIVYYRTARTEINTHRPGHPLLGRLQDPSWKSEFTNYRNALTHELLIAGSYSINVNVDGPTQTQRIVFPLPDDPRVDPKARTCKRNPDVVVYCNTTFRRLLSQINRVYGDLRSEIDTRRALPI